MRLGFLVLAVLAVAGCSDTPASPDPIFAEFVLDVEGERFTIRTSDADTIRLADENLQGRNRMFPMGTLRSGHGGFNAPWTWHLDPASVRFVEIAIEVCDGRPSYVEAHQPEFPTYCPWGARVVARR
jgi:hypothetical protein